MWLERQEQILVPIKYCRDLTMYLRRRGIDDAVIVSVLQEIQDSSRESGKDPIDAFGPPKEYAEMFPNRLGNVWLFRGSPGHRFTVTVVYLWAAVCLIAVLHSQWFVWLSRANPFIVTLLPPIICFVIISIVSQFLDRRLPDLRR